MRSCDEASVQCVSQEFEYVQQKLKCSQESTKHFHKGASGQSANLCYFLVDMINPNGSDKPQSIVIYIQGKLRLI